MIRVHSKSGRFIALLPETLAGGFAVVVTAGGVESFAGSWPCARLGNGPIRFEFAGNGDLVDMSRDTSVADGSAVLALCEDAQTFGERAMGSRRAKRRDKEKCC